MFFRNAQVYRLPPNWRARIAPVALDAQLCAKAFQPCGAMDPESRGWVSPTGTSAHLLPVRAHVAPLGIDIERIHWIGEVRLPTVVTHSINAKIQATQIAQQRENEVAAAKAEADKVIAQARGESESRLMLAKADADAIRIKAEALRKNPKLVELNAVERWDGKLPQNLYGSAPLPFLNVTKQ